MGNDLCHGCNGHTDETETMYRSKDAINDISERKNPNFPKSKVGQKPYGLQNLNNTCYMSSVLQVLFIILPDEMRLGWGKITRLFFQLKASRSTRDYRTFKNEIEKEIQFVRGNEQQDAQQFLIHILEVLDRENSTAIRKSKVHLEYNESLSVQQNYSKFQTEMNSLEMSPIINLFSGDLIRQLICSEKHTKHKLERFQCVSLSFPFNSSESTCYSTNSLQSTITLKELIQKQFGCQNIKGLQCQKCKRNTDFKKETHVYKAPKYFILHLSRFKKTMLCSEKINSVVQYGSSFSLTTYNSHKIINYRLMGTVNHSGSLNRGHFFSKVRTQDGSWYEINDHIVKATQIKQTSNRSESVYILVYQSI